MTPPWLGQHSYLYEWEGEGTWGRDLAVAIMFYFFKRDKVSESKWQSVNIG